MQVKKHPTDVQKQVFSHVEDPRSCFLRFTSALLGKCNVFIYQTVHLIVQIQLDLFEWTRGCRWQEVAVTSCQTSVSELVMGRTKRREAHSERFRHYLVVCSVPVMTSCQLLRWPLANMCTCVIKRITASFIYLYQPGWKNTFNCVPDIYIVS